MADRRYENSLSPASDSVLEDDTFATDASDVSDEDGAAEEDFEEELIIEDFTIDGICGVY